MEPFTTCLLPLYYLEILILAKVKLNPRLAALSGKFGKDFVLRQRKDGTTVVAAIPAFTDRVFSEEQLTHQSRFQQAVAYAWLATGATKTAYNIAVSDWFNPPVIRMVYRHHENIIVDATDDVQVAQVLVTIANEQGETIEQGEAVQNGSSIWEYRISTQGSIVVEAVDLAGNVTRHEA